MATTSTTTTTTTKTATTYVGNGVDVVLFVFTLDLRSRVPSSGSDAAAAGMALELYRTGGERTESEMWIAMEARVETPRLSLEGLINVDLDEEHVHNHHTDREADARDHDGERCCRRAEEGEEGKEKRWVCAPTSLRGRAGRRERRSANLRVTQHKIYASRAQILSHIIALYYAIDVVVMSYTVRKRLFVGGGSSDGSDSEPEPVEGRRT